MTNSIASAVHFGIVCDGCDMNPIRGLRFKSKTKDDFDLCGSCVQKELYQNDSYSKMDQLDIEMSRSTPSIQKSRRKGKIGTQANGSSSYDIQLDHVFTYNSSVRRRKLQVRWPMVHGPGPSVHSLGPGQVCCAGPSAALENCAAEDRCQFREGCQFREWLEGHGLVATFNASVTCARAIKVSLTASLPLQLRFCPPLSGRWL